MKRLLYILPIAALILPSCRVEDIQEPESSSGFAFRAAAVTSVTESPFRWVAVSDRVGVFARESGSGELLSDNVYYDAQTSTERSLFKPLKTGTGLNFGRDRTYDLGLYYPYRSSVKTPSSIPVSAPSEQMMSPDSPMVLDEVKAKALFVCTKTGVAVPETGTLETELAPAVALVRVMLSAKIDAVCDYVRIVGEQGSALSFEEGAYDLFASTLSTGEKTSSEIIVKPASAVKFGRTPVEFWARVNPDYDGDRLSVVCDVDGFEIDDVVIELPEGGLKPGMLINCDIALTDSSKDLSRGGSANCYIVNRPGVYSFRADVKGNGLPRSFDWNFEGESRSAGYSDVTIVPETAALLWYSTPETEDGFSGKSPISTETVFLNEGRVYFTVPADFEDGNAVIAAFDAAGEILWGWNIWAVRGYDAEASSRQVGRYGVMDRNLGAVLGPESKDISDRISAAGAIGNYYQWGRKDPFPAASEYSDGTFGIKDSWGNEAYTDIEACKLVGNRIFSDDRVQNGRMLAAELGSGYSMEAAIAESVKYPHKWMFGGTGDAEWPQYGWFADGNGYTKKSLNEQGEWRWIWGSLDNVTSEKTIYDPCPPGWKVPTADLFAQLFAKAEVSGGKHGLYFPMYDLYFPFAGQRKAGYGGSVIVGNGEVMVASASVSGCLYPTRGTAVDGGGSVTSGNSYIGAGLQIRCVREDVSAAAPSYGRQSGHRAALMGDSITRTWRDRGRKSFFTDNNYLNLGIDGTTSNNMVNRFSQLLNDDPYLTVITCGTNDFAENDGFYVSREDLLANIALMARMAEDKGMPVILGSIAPSRSMWWQSDQWKEKYDGDWVADKIIEANKLIKAYAESHGYKYADYHTALKDEQNGLAQKYMWAGTDSVHPNYDAFIVMEGILKPLIDALLHDPDETRPGGSGMDDLDNWEWK